MPQQILVTGASGFVGSNLVPYLRRAGYSIRAASRSGYEHRMPDLGDRNADWRSLLSEIHTVIHLAGLADSNNARDHEEINHRATARLVEQARGLGVKHFILVSSVAAQVGFSSTHIVREDDQPLPVSAYGKSKLSAEKAVQNSGIAYTILRPTAMYGKDIRGNLALLTKLARLPIPLPFGSLNGRRSMLAIDNFSSGVCAILNNPAASGRVFLMADPADSSVPELISEMRCRRGRKPGLINVPPILIRVCLKAAMMDRVWNRIGESLVVDSSRLRSIGWEPRDLKPPADI